MNNHELSAQEMGNNATIARDMPLSGSPIGQRSTTNTTQAERESISRLATLAQLWQLSLDHTVARVAQLEYACDIDLTDIYACVMATAPLS